MSVEKKPTPLCEQAPRSAAIVAVVMPGSPPYLQIDLFNTTATGDRILARYTANVGNTLEATSAFEMLLAGTLWGEKTDKLNVLQFPGNNTTT